MSHPRVLRDDALKRFPRQLTGLVRLGNSHGLEVAFAPYLVHDVALWGFQTDLPVACKINSELLAEP